MPFRRRCENILWLIICNGCVLLRSSVSRSRFREEQYTSSIVIAELYKGAFRSPQRETILKKIEMRMIPQLTILPFDRATAKIYGEILAQLEQQGQRLAHADAQIAATAI